MTRATVLEAASRLFAERGWAGTTLTAVAADAGTAVETLYAAFGSKSGLLIAAIDAAIVGDGESTPLEERADFARLGTGSRAVRLGAAAAIVTSALCRAVPLMGALQEAASNDEAARERLERYEFERHGTVAAGLELVLGAPPADELVDAMWAIAGPELFTKLTQQRGWPVERYEEWLTQTGLALLGRPRR